ncbi:MAG: HAMP domain-containing protein [Alphaproteobacteria bacterium]|nr:HAMP domain-containing protein [Alphaproteobacteria bacterium]
MTVWQRLRALGRRLVAPFTRSLSGRLLLLTIAFVMLSEVIVYIPSLCLYHTNLLSMRLAAAQLAALPLSETDRDALSDDLRRELLANAGVIAVSLKRSETRELYLAEEMPPQIDAAFDITSPTYLSMLADTFDALTAPAGRTIRIMGVPRLRGGEKIDVVMNEDEIRGELFAYSQRIFLLSLLISGATALLVFVSVSWAFVRPVQRLTRNMLAFRERPEDAYRILEPSGREDEIGRAEETLAQMQSELRMALHQRAHLAALGTSVAKINHDLRNLLATAQLTSDRIATVSDPAVQRLAPRLISAIDRAVELTSATLRYARAEEAAPQRRLVPLRPVVEEVLTACETQGPVTVENLVPGEIEIDADPDQLFRLLMNIVRNAVQVLEAQGQGSVRVIAIKSAGKAVIDIADNGPGIPERAREHLFEPFTGSARSGGTGLGLAIAKELALAHGGDITLIRTGAEGTVFRITIPDSDLEDGA